MICRHCGATLPPIAMFCGECGRSVAARTPVVPPVVLTDAAPVFSAGDVLSITPASPPEAPDPPMSQPPVSEPPSAEPPVPLASETPPTDGADPGPGPVRDAPAGLVDGQGAPPPVCASCGTTGEPDDLFCAECGAPLPQDTRVIERLQAPGPAGHPRPTESAASVLAPTPGDAQQDRAPQSEAEPAPDSAPASPLPSWASLLTGTSAAATSGPFAQSAAASSVVVPGAAAAAPPSPGAAPAPEEVRPPASVPSAPAAPAPPPVVERPADRDPARPLPPLAPPPRWEPDVESTRLVPRAATGVRFVLQFSTGESYTVVGSGLIGRNPRSEPGEAVDHLVTIADPGRSVSKTHLEFGQDSGVFFISDRHSGNGTIIREPGAEPRYAEPGRRYRVVRGTRVDLGEQFVVIS